MARVAVTAGIVLALSGVIGWISPAEVSHPLPAGCLFDVAVQGDAAVFDLPLTSASERYLLVVANLSRDVPPRQVTLAAEAVKAIRFVPLTNVPALETRELEGVIPASRKMQSGPTAQPLPSTDASSRTFWLHLGQGSYDNSAAYRPIKAHLAGEGAHVRVYVDGDDAVHPTAMKPTVQAIVGLYENDVLPKIAKQIGMPADVDGDGKLAILMTSWLDRLSADGLGGMVWSGDFRADGKPPFSNRADVVYLNANLRPGAHTATLLAHELTHAVTASGRLASDSMLFVGDDEESWLNEAISHVAENLQGDNWSNLDYRIAAFLKQEPSTPLVVSAYSQHGLWRSPSARGSTYLFLRWCVDRYGTGLLSRLIYSPRQGVKNLEAATEQSFDELFRRWAVDLYLRPVDPYHSQPPVPSAADVPRPDVYGTVGRHALTGPRRDAWNVADPTSPPAFPLAGTSFRHLVLSASRPGVWRVRVAAEPGARLQLTLLRLGDGGHAR